MPNVYGRHRLDGELDQLLKNNWEIISLNIIENVYHEYSSKTHEYTYVNRGSINQFFLGRNEPGTLLYGD